MNKRKYIIRFLGEMDQWTNNYFTFEIKIQWNSNKKIIQVKVPRKAAKERTGIDIYNMDDKDRKKVYAYALAQIKDLLNELDKLNEVVVEFNYEDPFKEISSIGWSVEDFLNRKPLDC